MDVKSSVWVGLRKYRYTSGHFELIVIFFFSAEEGKIQRSVTCSIAQLVSGGNQHSKPRLLFPHLYVFPLDLKQVVIEVLTKHRS